MHVEGFWICNNANITANRTEMFPQSSSSSSFSSSSFKPDRFKTLCIRMDTWTKSLSNDTHVEAHPRHSCSHYLSLAHYARYVHTHNVMVIKVLSFSLDLSRSISTFFFHIDGNLFLFSTNFLALRGENGAETHQIPFLKCRARHLLSHFKDSKWYLRLQVSKPFGSATTSTLDLEKKVKAFSVGLLH